MNHSMPGLSVYHQLPESTQTHVHLVGDAIQPVHPKGDRSWVFTRRTDVETETPILWPTDAKSWLIWKDPDAGKDWGQEEKGMTEDEMDCKSSLQSKGLSRVFSNTTVEKHQFFSAQLSL